MQANKEIEPYVAAAIRTLNEALPPHIIGVQVIMITSEGCGFGSTTGSKTANIEILKAVLNELDEYQEFDPTHN